MATWQHVVYLLRASETRAAHILAMLQSMPVGDDARSLSVMSDVDNCLELVQASLMAQLKLRGMDTHPGLDADAAKDYAKR